MKLHEKTLESNITHELLSLADSWNWFLVATPLWDYWRPKFRLPFVKYPKSTSAGFYITTEGKDDPKGEEGGGFDIRIKAGNGGHLLFIQFKKGDFAATSPDDSSVFATEPHSHYVFKINGTKTNQHFVLRNLANHIGKEPGNAVVYALPLINDMEELERNAGKLLRKTKFISVIDIDREAEKAGVQFIEGEDHSFRVGTQDMNRCEVSSDYFLFGGLDRTPEILADVVALRFRKTLDYALKEYKKQILDKPSNNYFPIGLRRAFSLYTRYLHHYFEVSPSRLEALHAESTYVDYFEGEYDEYENADRDVQLLGAILTALSPYGKFLVKLERSPEQVFSERMPSYEPKILIPSNGESRVRFNSRSDDSRDIIESVYNLVV